MSKTFIAGMLFIFLIGIGGETCQAAQDIKPPPGIPYGRLLSMKIERYKGPYKAEFMNMLDGDSILARVHVWPSVAIETEVRIHGIDAPETTRAKCPKEKRAGIKAHWALVSRLVHNKQANGERYIELENVKFGKYAGRVLADIFYRDRKGRRKSLGQELLRLGFVRPYYGGKRQNWCP